MPSRPTPPPATSPDPAGPAFGRPSTWRPKHWLAFAVIALITVMWIAVIVSRLVTDEADRVGDAGFRSAAEAVCADARAGFPPPAPDDEEWPEKLARLQAENAELATMVDALEALPPPADAEDAANVAAWLTDWETHLDERLRFTAGIASEQADLVFNGSTFDDESIQFRMDRFASVNDMESCETPPDL